MARRALIAGATGLVGARLLQALLADRAYGTVRVFARRPLAVEHPKLVVEVIDFDRLQDVRFPRVDDVFCCLGTTIAAAGSRAAFRRVDYDYPLAIARAALAAHARQFLFVSAMGADPRSKVFYSRVKGELEQAVAGLGYRSVVAFRPSLLAGDRQQHRLGERAALAVLQPLRFLVPRKYRPVAAVAVAQAMLTCASRGHAGFTVIESDAMQGSAEPGVPPVAARRSAARAKKRR
jgi:uncharacterized protein YbjT (DUF2867 family)